MNEAEMPDNRDEYSTNVEGKACRGLTCIGKCIHCPATRNESEAGHELDDIAIEQFLDTLAEVAISIATRESYAKEDTEQYP